MSNGMTESVEGIIYDGHNLTASFTDEDYNGAYLVVNDVRGRGITSNEIGIVKVLGKSGGYRQDERIDVRVIEADITVKGTSFTDLRYRVEQLNKILHVKDDVPIVFADEPDRIYYGKIEDVSDSLEISNIYQTTLTFLCVDPYKYGHEQSVMVGFPDSHEPLELAMHDNMESTSAWSKATNIDNGHVGGNIVVNKHGFSAERYGDAVEMNRWQGPSLTRPIGDSLQDFRADVIVRQMDRGVGTGMIEIYFRDASGNRIAKIGIENLYADTTENQTKARIGPGRDYHDIYAKPDPEFPHGWDDFEGILRIERVGNVWKPYFAKIESDGTHNWVRGVLRYTDIMEKASAPITDVQVAIRKFPAPDGEETDMAVEDIKIFKVNDKQAGMVLNNRGTAESFPVFKHTIEDDEDTSRVSFRNSDNQTAYGADKMVVLGYPKSPNMTVIKPLVLIMHDTMRSASSWQTADEIDNGYIDGNIGVNKYGFYPEKYGGAIDMKRWQGPSVKRAIGQPLQDFRADVLIRHMNIGPKTGMIEIYFRDANGNRIAKIGLENLYTNEDANQGKVRIGSGSNYHDIYTKPDPKFPHGWNNFDGILRLERVGNVWKPYFAKIESDGKHNWVKSTLRYTDNRGIAAAPITEVQVAIRKYPGPEGTATDMAVKEIKIYQINKVTDHESQVEKTFDVGDEIEVDSATGLVQVNGEQRIDLVDLQTEFFSLVPGLNKLSAPHNTEVIWTDRFL